MVLFSAKKLSIGKQFPKISGVHTGWLNSQDLLTNFGKADFFSSIELLCIDI
ncbi:MAG: hypothetical protein ACJAWV_000588 [Flammeovirgaceae bacterium]|jgi:hypothetical protein